MCSTNSVLIFRTICSPRTHQFIVPGFPSITCLLLSDIASGLQIAAHAFSSAFAERDENAAATLTITTATELFQVQRDMGVSVSFPTYDLKAITINGVPNFPSDFQYVEWLKRIPNGGNLMVDYSRHLAIPVPLLASGRNDTRYDVGAFFDHWNNL